MAIAGEPIEAVLTLNADKFKGGLESSLSAVENFKKTILEFPKEISKFKASLDGLEKDLDDIASKFKLFNSALGDIKNLKDLGQFLKNISGSIKILSSDTVNLEQGMIAINNIFKAWGDTVGKATINVNGIKTAIKELIAETKASSNITPPVPKVSEGQLNALRQMRNEIMGLYQAERSLDEVNNTINRLSTNLNKVATTSNSSSKSVSTMTSSVKTLGDTINTTTGTITRMVSPIRNASGEFARLKAEMNTVSESYRVLKINADGENVTLEKSSVALRQNTLEMERNAEAKLRALGYTGQITTAEERLANAEKQVNSSTQQASSSLDRYSSSSARATASTNAQTNATNRLKSAMSSLKMIGSLVASMMVWNFASSLINATRETVNAKSEMEGYFQMLHFSQYEIKDFNDALTETVNRFQRINKYALGETISSIGVEFNLSMQEMKKAMPVVSMITSEYLRAGRNVNEASLAVKDILQGEFQRLSRETGVKGDQLKEAGWSGDKKDVMGLLEALDKVGKSRNWDVFVTKANSLNDAILILQNRFSEWTADMFYEVQPTIVGVFNMLMGTAEKFTSVFSGIYSWLKSDGIAQSVVQWTGLATAIGVAVTSLVHYRTGAGLVQIAQMGLRGSIMATILQLDAQIVAEQGVSKAIASKITGLKAEQLGELTTRNAIASKILGLNAEKVAQMGLKGTIMEGVLAKKLEEIANMNVSNSQKAEMMAQIQSDIAKKGTLATIFAKIMAVDMETFAEHGLLVAILETKTGMEAETIASKGLITQMGLLASTTLVTIGVLVGVVAILGSMALAMKNSADEMKKFNDIAQNGEEIVKSKRQIVADYTNRQEKLKKKLSETTKGTRSYNLALQESNDVTRDLEVANKDLENSYEALQKVNSANKKFEETRTEQALQMQGKLAQAYINAGYSSTEAYKMANDSLQEANKGADQLYEALQRLQLAQDRRVQGNTYLLDMFGRNNVDKDTAERQLREYNEYQVMIEKGLEKGLTDDSFFGRLDGWLTHYQGQIGVFWENLESSWISGDYEEMFANFGKGVSHFFETWNPMSDVVHAFGDALNLDQDLEWGEYSQENVDKILDAIRKPLDMAGGKIHEIVMDWVNTTFIDPFKDFDLLSLIFGQPAFASDGSSDHPSFMEDLSAIMGFDVQSWIDSFMADPLGTLGVQPIDIGQILFPQLFGLYEGAVGIATWVDTNLILPLKNGISQGIASIPILSDIASMLGLIPQANPDAQNKGTQLARAFGNAVETIVGNIPILGDVLRFLGVIPQANPTAKSNGKGVGDSVKQGVKDGINGLADLVKEEIDRIKNYLENKAKDIYNSAKNYGSNLLQGFRDAMDMNSPSIISKELLPDEFGVRIPQVLSDSSAVAYSSAQGYGQAIVDGISSVNNDFSLGGVADEYQTDAQTIATYSQMMGTDTTMAFNDMTLAVNGATTQMSTNVASTYSQIQTRQATMLNSMKSSNLTAYQQMNTQSNQSLLQMRDSTSNVTNQMVHAWAGMKDSIVATANSLRSETTAHFNTLSSNIGSFYRKIQNPSNWGAGHSSSLPTRGARNSRLGKAFVSSITSRSGKHGAGGNARYSPYTGGNATMSLRQLKHMICPRGNCDIFDGYDMSQVVNVSDFLSSITGEHGFGWTGWNRTHYQHIRSRSNEWGMKSPILNVVGGIPTNANFKVGEFETGTPKISWGAFQSMAESLFSNVPYAFYYDSEKYGSWQNALAHGECNCSDGADAIIAFAQTCGFSGYKQHGTWVDPDGTSYGHFYAVINGKKMDTTGWQQRRSWSAGSPPNSSSKPTSYGDVNVTINVYGDDVEVDENAVDLSTAQTIIDLVGINPSTGV